MTEVPGLFRAAATWAEGRPFGDPAGMAVRALLTELTGPPRIGVCTLDAPVEATIPGAVMVRTTWPAVGSGTDMVLLIHRGTIPGRVRSRMRAGPQKFIHIEDKEQAENYRIVLSQLSVIRTQLLSGGLRALATRFPEVTTLIANPVPESMPAGERRIPRVVLIGPEPGEVTALRETLTPHLQVVDSADADVVVAVPGHHGFLLADAPTLQDAWHRVGRMVTLSPLPAGICPAAVPAGRDLVATIKNLAAKPAQMTIPTVPSNRWGQVIQRLDTHYRSHAQQLRHRDDRAGMRRLAARHGITLPQEPRLPFGELIFVTGLLLGTGLLRPEMIPVVLVLSGVRLVQQYRRRRRQWWEESCREPHLDITSGARRGGRGPREWLREQFREEERAG